jgi:hypothetical protein
MKRLAFLLFAAFAMALPALADPYGAVTPGTAGTQTSLGGCYYESSPAAATSGQQRAVHCDTAGNALIAGSTASGSADSGNPVKIAGVYNSTLPTFTTGQRGDVQLSSRGSLFSVLTDSSGNAIAVSPGADGSSNAVVSLSTYARGVEFNGSTWDREFTCNQSASINVTASNTTQVVALSGSTTIRVCSIVMSMSAAGTAGVVTGTGTNCGSGTATLMADTTLGTGTPVALSAANGSLFRSIAGGEICVKAATGNVQGFLSYAQY